MIGQDDLAEARSRITLENDRDIFDEALRRAQGLDPCTRTMIEMALSMAGLEPSDLAYQQHLYPYDPPASAAEMARSQSGCGLTTEAIWRAGEVSDARLKLPYGPRCAAGGVLYAVALEKAIAQHHGAWFDASRTGFATFEPGDAPIIGCKGCPGVWAKNTLSDEHEFTVLYVEDDGVTVHSLDGAQERGIAIRTRRVVFVPQHKEVWLASLEATTERDGRPSKGRRLLGITRSVLLLRDIDSLPPPR
jgi:hypothetical protein